MTTRYSGVVSVTGEHDSGTTHFMLEVAPYPKMALFHDDVKLPPHPDKLGLFVDMVNEAKGLKLLEFRQFVLEKIKGIKSGQFEAIIFDTWTRFGLSLRQYAVLNPNEFREPQTFSKLGAAKGGEMWNEAHRYEAQVIAELSKLAPFVGLVTHLKDELQAGARTGKQIPDAGKSLNRVCNFRVWLRKNPNSGVPIALVLKRLSEDVVGESGYLETVNIMPWKLVPRLEDKSVWDTIDYYRSNPFGNRPATPEETPDSFEMSILTGVMTPEQREIWRANLQEKQIVDREQESLVTQEEQAIKAFVSSQNGKPLPMLKTALEGEAKDKGWSRQEFDLGYISQLLT